MCCWGGYLSGARCRRSAYGSDDVTATLSSLRVKRVKSFPSLTAHWAALISVPLALSQTPAYTAKTADTGSVHHAVCPFTPRRLGRYQIILLDNRGTWVWTTCPELLPDSGTAGIKLTTYQSWVRHPNHYATRPPISCFIKIQNGLPFFCRLTQMVLKKRPLNGTAASEILFLISQNIKKVTWPQPCLLGWHFIMPRLILHMAK